MTDAASSIPGIRHKDDSETSLSTLPDPRTASSSDLSRTASNSSRHPDLSAEVAALSDKLISAINYQTSLDDTLAHTRHELEASKARIRQLEAEAKEHEEQLSSGMLLTKGAADDAKSKLMANLAEERKAKSAAQQEKRGIEQELESLTASLFEEANEMVASANRDKDAVERKNQQLRDQIKDTESLLVSQQEQLTELKVVMQQMSTTQDDQESVRDSTAPSSPGMHREDTMSRLMEVMNLSPATPGDGKVSPAPSTSFTHLLKTVCRTDLPAYEDFRGLISVAKSQPGSRVTSGTYSGLNVMSLSSLTGTHTLPSNGSSTSLAKGGTPSTTPSTPATPGSFNSVPKELTPLKETKFYKRLLTEDVEPTLRLDLAPGISWLTRRSLLNAVAEGSLIVEPIPEASRKLYGRYTACAVCGESRKGGENPRTHRMKTSDGEGATRWQLCSICLEKIRATCDLVGFVRMIKDGVMRIGDPEAEKEAWEELVQLRERMFWARMAAGVIPAFMERKSEKGSPVIGRTSQDSSTFDRSAIPTSNGAIRKEAGLFNSNAVKRGPFDNGGPDSPPSSTDGGAGNDTSDEAEQQLHSSLRQSADGLVDEKENEQPRSARDGSSVISNKGLKIAVPGGFE